MCRGLLGRQFGGSRVPKKKFYNFEEPSQRPKTAKRAPKFPPRRPQMSPREPQDTCKSIFLAKTLIYLKIANSLGEINVFHQVPKGVGTEMRALVASWGLLLHDEGAWGGVEGCRGLFGRQFGGSRVPKKKFYNFEEPSQSPKTAKRAPKCPPRRPQMSPREPQGTRKSIFLAKTLIYQK